MITARHYFLYKFVITQRFGETAMLLCSLKQVLWKNSTFSIHFLHNNITIVLIPNKRPTTKFLLLKFIDTVFSFNLWMFHIFFNCYLAAPWPTWGHSQGNSLTNPILINAFYLCRPECCWEPCNEVGSLSPPECQAGFEPGTFQF